MRSPRADLTQRFPIFLGLSVGLSLSCGIQAGPGAPPNDPPPSGSIVAQGPFNSLVSGKTVTGNALIYAQGGGNFVARLEGISAPSENGLLVQVYTGSTQDMSQGLRATTGNQNYPFTATATTFNYVSIHSAPNNQDYGQALLQ